MSSDSPKITIGMIVLHTVLVLITGGIWGIVLLVWLALKQLKS